MLKYDEIKANERRLLALTSLKGGEFDYLLKHFSPICERYFRYHTYEGKKRKLPAFKPHQDEKLPTSSDKLLFLLTYLKGNQLQEFHGAVYDLSQAKVSSLVKILQRLLDETLHKMGLSPARDSEGLVKQLQNHPDDTFNHDATERPIERKTDYEAQKEDYSGKSKAHTSKNEIVSDQASELLYVSPTYEGKTHDKALLDEEQLTWIVGIKLRQDTGYQGYNPAGVTILQPTKKPRGASLTDQQKEVNRHISKERVVIEHAIAGLKRLRILKERIRLKFYDVRDRMVSIGCALHNLRVKSPFRKYAPRTGMWAS
ncbi:HARBI1 family protein [Spirosoma telluris]